MMDTPKLYFVGKILYQNVQDYGYAGLHYEDGDFVLYLEADQTFEINEHRNEKIHEEDVAIVVKRYSYYYSNNYQGYLLRCRAKGVTPESEDVIKDANYILDILEATLRMSKDNSMSRIGKSVPDSIEQALEKLRKFLLLQ